MRIIDEVLGRTPERPLFHYTTANGMLGLLNEGAIWASNAYHLNDAQEFRYAIGLIKERMALRIKHENGPNNSIYGTLLEELDSVVDDLQVFIASFSEEGDLLSQWLAYSGTNGYALQIGADNIKSAVSDGFSLVRCVYRPDDQVRLAEAFIDMLYDQDQYPEKDAGVKAVIVAASIKHPGFEREAEWRLVKSVPMFWGTNETIFFRAGRNGIVPYVKAPLCSSGTRYVPDRIYVGPNSDMHAAKISLKSLLFHRKLLRQDGTAVEVVPSMTPYRP